MGRTEFDRGQAFPDADEQETNYVGTYGGVVVDNKDPDGTGRVRVRISGMLEKSDWALPVTMGGGGPGEGTYHPPPQGADVFVWFLDGNVNSPCYAGGFWGKDERVPGIEGIPAKDRPMAPAWETPRHLISLDGREAGELLIRDKQSSAEMAIRGSAIEVMSGEVTIAAGGTMITLNSGTVTIKADSAVIDAGSVSLAGGGPGVARQGDSVQVTIPPGVFHVTNPGLGPPTVPSPTPVVVTGTVTSSSGKTSSG